MSTAAATKRASEEDFFALPDGVKAELISGEILMAPSALAKHGLLQAKLSTMLDPYSRKGGPRGPGGWHIIVEVDVRLRHGLIVRPDLAGWRRERMPNLPETIPVDLVPDWICEVVSPSNARHDRIRKRKIYAEFGVQHYWIVDPTEETLEPLQLHEGRWLEQGILGRGDKIQVEPFAQAEWLIDDLMPE